MKVQVSLSAAAKFYTTKYGNNFILTLESIEKREIKKNLNYTYRDVPFAHIDMAFVWDKGYEEERVEPTLDMIQVPTRKQGKGLGEKLLDAVLAFMRKKNLQSLTFSNFNEQFWDHVAKKYRSQFKIKYHTRRKNSGVITLM